MIHVDMDPERAASKPTEIQDSLEGCSDKKLEFFAVL